MAERRCPLLVLAASDGTAETAGKEKGQRLHAYQSTGHNDQPLPLFLKVLFYVFPAAVSVDPGRRLVQLDFGSDLFTARLSFHTAGGRNFEKSGRRTSRQSSHSVIQNRLVLHVRVVVRRRPVCWVSSS